MKTARFDFTPFIPAEMTLDESALPDKASDLIKQSAILTGQLSVMSLSALEHYMQAINSYYSNLIEGNETHPHEIRAAQRGNYSGDPVKRDLQKESLGHMAVQQWVHDQSPDLDRIFTPEFILSLHKQFYDHIPESLWEIKDKKGAVVDTVVPGMWRKKMVDVGAHVAPAPESIEILMANFCKIYHPGQFNGDRKLVSIMAAHHRFAWIHPFLDGNGRVGRLLTDAALKAVGLDSYGAWCLSRGLAKSSTQYKRLLAAADSVRQGDLDGRGALTERGLVNFCDYMLDTAIDQVTYMGELLDLGNLGRRINTYVQARNDFRVGGIEASLKPSAALVLHMAFVQGELERAQALELCAMPERSARRLLSQMRKEGLLSETSSKSPLRWEIPEHAEAWYFPDLTPVQ